MLVDDVTIRVKAGNGGRGAVGFSKTKMTLGPTGGRGGRGGNAYLEAVIDLGALRRFRSTKSFAAENGEDGRNAYRDGRDGKNLVLLVPRGTVVQDLTANTEHELTKAGERLLIAEGGKGGKGNFHYKSSRHTTPTKFQNGLSGEEHSLRLTLKLIADIGLVGLPNVGKSSFLNEVTRAQSPVANYAFTTLEPYLGAYDGLVLADIPGLIEGASSGKGLGMKFLRHVERTRILFHFIDVNTEDPVKDYRVIRKELGAYSPALLKKPEYLFISKTDTADMNRVTDIKKVLETKVKDRKVIALSIHDLQAMTETRKLLERIMENAAVEQSERAMDA